MNNIKKYKSLIFDCDGVILNSNKLKIEAFRIVLKKFNPIAVEELIIYLKNNFGTSRYVLLDMFLNNIVQKYEKNHLKEDEDIKKLIQDYSNECKILLFNSEVAKDLKKLRELTSNIPWFIVSGGDQEELRQVFKYKKLNNYFNGGIYGSPKNKIDIIKNHIQNGIIKHPALMIGDSKLDHLAAKHNQIDFIFASEWSCFKDYAAYCKENSIKRINTISEILNTSN